MIERENFEQGENDIIKYGEIIAENNKILVERLNEYRIPRENILYVGRTGLDMYFTCIYYYYRERYDYEPINVSPPPNVHNY